ncbi:MAG TPA: hypothetical protein VGS10_05005 [Terracidiphilus sp.]|nr:hypothetical protein [Terracidiphilus sp.]
MKSLPGSLFSHRRDSDGAVVFTCSTCFAAVATSLLKAAFDKAEQDHTCNPEMLEHWKLFIDEIKQRDQRRKPRPSI